MTDFSFKNAHEAVAEIDSYTGGPESFLLPINDCLQDPIGMYMALITDKILAKGWEPNGFEQKNGYRVYRYKLME